MASNFGAAVSDVVAERGLWYGRLCTTSSSVIILYDHLITFSDEVHLIWKSRWSAGKALFLISRYYNVFTVFRYYNVFTVLFNSNVLYSSTISSRLSSKRIFLVLVVGFSSVLIAETIILVLSTKAQIGPVNADPSRQLDMATCILTDTWPLSYLYWIPFLTFESLLFALALFKGFQSVRLDMATCILTDTWPLSYLYWIPFLAFESLLFALALFKGFQSVRDHELELNAAGFGLGFCRKARGIGAGRAAKALEVLIRDSILYFVVIFAIYLANALAWMIDNGRIGEIPVGLAVALSTVMAQRLLFNIRENFEKRRAGVDANASTAAASETFALSTMAFDGLCIISDSEPEARRTSKIEHGYREGRMKTMTGSMFSGSTAVSPVSPLGTSEANGPDDMPTMCESQRNVPRGQHVNANASTSSM
ncbi:hypothetical protein A7U60_g5719 [Sanghuangporus baumii]|uniref:DUF6533 domain-containing protein n=1 Tax=Sanghuangporus baumii TaxID=108892 RepID=A0A9Q5HWB7_SANBA|nr:hypothetical protein A7U60_g5719 [Sanghuangporus baumii]